MAEGGWWVLLPAIAALRSEMVFLALRVDTNHQCTKQDTNKATQQADAFLSFFVLLQLSLCCRAREESSSTEERRWAIFILAPCTILHSGNLYAEWPLSMATWLLWHTGHFACFFLQCS